jgi:uncharacterized protein YecE (DUF72 family)
MARRLRIGTAGWAIPRTVADAFPAAGTGLQRYAGRLVAAEVNSSFYRSHRPATWARWRDSTPSDFRFAVKAPRAATHEAKLAGCRGILAAFVAEAAELVPKLGPVLVQLPPSLALDPPVADRFFGELRELYAGPVACEPRHVSWFEADGDALLERHRVARVAADPPRHPRAFEPAGWRGLAYWRLHGSPRMYWSSYDDAALDALATAMRASSADEVWCIFDNTTSGAAAANALELQRRLDQAGPNGA